MEGRPHLLYLCGGKDYPLARRQRAALEHWKMLTALSWNWLVLSSSLSLRLLLLGSSRARSVLAHLVLHPGPP